MMNNNHVIFEGSHCGFNEPTIKSVQLDMESSTYNAEVFNMAMKMLCLDWQDSVIQQIEDVLNQRLLEIEQCKDQGYDYLISFKKSNDHTFKVAYRVHTEERARELAKIKYPHYEISSVERREIN